MAQAAKSQELSMEEILASIQRIIAEDDPEKSQQRPAEAAGPDFASDAGPPTGRRDEELSHSTPSYSAPVAAGPQHETRSAILDLTESMASSAPRPPAPTFNSNARVARPALLPEVVEGAEATFDPADAKEDAKQTASGLMQPGGEQDEARGGLMSSATSAAVDSAFNALAQTCPASSNAWFELKSSGYRAGVAVRRGYAFSAAASRAAWSESTAGSSLKLKGGFSATPFLRGIMWTCR